jgi:hypothetical protein
MMRTRWSMAVLCALWLVAPAAHGSGFEGLLPDDGAQPAIAGEILAIDAEARSFRVGGLTFFVAPGDDALDGLQPGRVAVVHYRREADGFRATRIELILAGKD